MSWVSKEARPWLRASRATPQLHRCVVLSVVHASCKINVRTSFFEIKCAHKCLHASRTQVQASGNLLRADGAKAFGDALKVNKTITEIDLSDNEIGGEQKEKSSWNMQQFNATPEGPAALAEGLKMNSTVTKVRVQNRPSNL